MKNLTIEERKESFERKFPDYASFVVHNGALYTTWVIGAVYKKNTDFYGAYPYKVKERIELSRELVYLIVGLAVIWGVVRIVTSYLEGS